MLTPPTLKDLTMAHIKRERERERERDKQTEIENSAPNPPKGLGPPVVYALTTSCPNKSCLSGCHTFSSYQISLTAVAADHFYYTMIPLPSISAKVYAFMNSFIYFLLLDISCISWLYHLRKTVSDILCCIKSSNSNHYPKKNLYCPDLR
jgi:hypothetical protein